MHIPDGMLDTKTFGTLWAGAFAGIGYAGYWVRKNFDNSKIVLMAVMAALIFALQMLNFPIAGGTSGHFTGGALLGIMLGAWPGAIVMTGVLLIQALFFGDGGITTLAANIVNLSFIGCFTGALVYQVFVRISKSFVSKIAGASLGAFLAVVFSAAAVAIQLWASNTAEFTAAFTAMVFWHSIIGVGEAVITGGIIAYLLKVRPQILEDEPKERKGSMKSVVVVFAVAAVLAASLSFLASENPDGLEYTYHDMEIGTVEIAEEGLFPAPMPGYTIKGVGNETLAIVGAGIIGTLITGLFVWALALALSRRNKGQGTKETNAEDAS
ncbi:MAG: PDGLE domain-containing protein [Coriobacteriia bacterium]|nr:PDGLE domain-containing protein [Coriobacteriia bacterium]